MGQERLKRASKARDNTQKRRNTHECKEELKEQSTSEDQLRDKLAFILMAVGLCMVSATAYLACILTLKYEGALVAFGILVFMVGATLVVWGRSIQGTYITYMWLAALVVIGSITGVSVIGTLIKP